MSCVCTFDVQFAIMAGSERSAFCVFKLYWIFLILLSDNAGCIEKTLRKIVRNQSKMVQRPFSETGSAHNTLINQSRSLHSRNITGHTQVKSVFNKHGLPKVSPVLSKIETGQSASKHSRKEITRNHVDIRNVNYSFNDLPTEFVLLDPPKGANLTRYEISNVYLTNNAVNKKLDRGNIYLTNNPVNKKSDYVNRSFKKKKLDDITNIDKTNTNRNKMNINPYTEINTFVSTEKNEEEYQKDISKIDDYSNKDVSDKIYHDDYPLKHISSLSSGSCTPLFEQIADIDAQQMYTEFNINPNWLPQKQFWNRIFDSRYESLMRNPEWPPLKVILIPRSQVDSIWRKSFDTYHTNTVSKILSNIVKKLQYYSNLTFNWNEVSHLSRWWKHTTQKNRMGFRRLLREGRLEITTGGWVEPDEGTSHIFGLVHQLVEGHQWLQNNLNYVPEVAWLTNTVSHTQTIPYLLSASGINYIVLTNLHFSWEEWLAEYQYSDFIWLQNWQNNKLGASQLDEPLNRIGKKRLSKYAVFSHFLQFNSADFKACGPNTSVCMDFNFAKKYNTLTDILPYNIKEKAENLLEQYSKSGTISPHNVIIAPIGGPFRYELQNEFDYQYNNYMRLIEFVNANQDIYKATMQFGVPKMYFKNALQRHKVYPTLKGDFVNFADVTTGVPAYWTGYYTSRPLFKILLRRLLSTLRNTEILFSFAINLNTLHGTNITGLISMLVSARESVARLMDRHSVGGTFTKTALKYAHTEISKTVKNCWYLKEFAVSSLIIKRNYKYEGPFVHKYIYRDGEFVSTFRTVIPNDKLYIFNSLAYERIEIIELTTRYPKLRILDHLNKEITIQINPIWKYNTKNIITISTTFYKIVFMIIVPPMTIEMVQIKETYDTSHSVAVLYCSECNSEDSDNTNFYPFKFQALERGDIQVENYKLRLTFDEHTGFLKSIVDKETNLENNVVIDYSAFKSSDQNSGMFLFKTNSSKPIYDILKPYKLGISKKIVLIVVGDITTELTVVYGRLLQHTIKIFNFSNNPFAKAIHVETQVDYEYSPKNRELELFLSIQTDITNGDLPEIVTDTNGFQYTTRKLNISRQIESNVYPFTTLAYIQDQKSRLNLITDHAQGITALQEGQMIILLDRRVLFNDGRGNNEGLSDSSKTYHRHIILLEYFIESDLVKDNQHFHDNELTLPSFSALYLSNSLNYDLSVFIVQRNSTALSKHIVLPLMKTPLPCNVFLLNYRTIFDKSVNQMKFPTSALLILHKLSFSCQIDKSLYPHCQSEDIVLENILYRARVVYKTLLTGTDKGTVMRHLDMNNFSPMEIITLRVIY